ncbi:MAG: dockerin type I repeat-containing protein [Myxococcota bacterium]|nr:dockerin type I repeat-containing protein [Myxococcota bacterium]
MLTTHCCRSASYLLLGIAAIALLYPDSVSAEQFTRGDVDANGTVDVRDARLLFKYLRGRKVELICPDAADMDDNGVINYKDIRRSLRYLFRRGRPPAAPGPMACGSDPTPDALGACVFDPCPQLTDENDPPEPWSPFES